MYNIDVMSILLFLINGVLGFLYSKKFLKMRRSGIWNFVVWMLLYLSVEMLMEYLSLNDVVATTLSIMGMLVLQLLLFRKDISWQIFVTISFYAGRMIVKYIASVVAFILPEMTSNLLIAWIQSGSISIEAMQRIHDILGIGVLILSEVIYAAIFLLYLRVIAKKFVRKDYDLNFYENLFLIVPCICAMCISVTLHKLVIVMEENRTILVYESIPETIFWIPLLCVLLLGTIISAVILFQRLVWHTEEEKKNSILENQIEHLQRETKEIQSVYADMRGLRHDLKGHLNNITMYLRDRLPGEDEEILHYVGKMEETVDSLEFTYQTGNPITDVIIHQKMQEATGAKIDFRSDFLFPDKLCIDVYDISIVLNNALENAMEACKSTGDKGVINLSSYVKGNLFFIEIRNNYVGELLIDEESGLPVSSKKKKKLHGIGLENIRRCAVKYHGDIDIAVSTENGMSQFMLTIMMCGKISHHK